MWQPLHDLPMHGVPVLIATDEPRFEVARLFRLASGGALMWELPGYHADGVERWLPLLAATAWMPIEPVNC